MEKQRAQTEGKLKDKGPDVQLESFSSSIWHMRMCESTLVSMRPMKIHVSVQTLAVISNWDPAWVKVRTALCAAGAGPKSASGMEKSRAGPSELVASQARHPVGSI